MRWPFYAHPPLSAPECNLFLHPFTHYLRPLRRPSLAFFQKTKKGSFSFFLPRPRHPS